MKKWMMMFGMCMLGITTVCFADEKKTETETETKSDTEDETVNISLEIFYEMPHTRSVFPAIPEAVLQGTSVRVTFDEPLPYVDIRVLDAGSGAVVFASAYAYESEVELDLSGYPKGSYIIRMETETAVYEGTFSL